MSPAQVEALLALIESMVNEDGPWLNKAQYLYDAASDAEKAALLEFCAWFAEDGPAT